MRESTKLFKIIISAGRELFEFQPAANAINMRAAGTVVATQSNAKDQASGYGHGSDRQLLDEGGGSSGLPTTMLEFQASTVARLNFMLASQFAVRSSACVPIY